MSDLAIGALVRMTRWMMEPAMGAGPHRRAIFPWSEM